SFAILPLLCSLLLLGPPSTLFPYTTLFRSAPFLYGLYWKGVTRAGVWSGFIAGIGITVSNMFIGYIASPINAGAAAMIAGLIVVPAVSLFTPKLKREKVDEIFTCYDEKVTITKKRSLQ